MSDSGKDNNVGWFSRNILPWLHTPDTYKVEGKNFDEEEAFEKGDNVWHDFHLFHGDWVEVVNKKEWYDSPHVPQIYANHKKILKQNMQLNRPFEEWYAEKIDNGDFESHMYVNGDGLPSGNGDYRIYIEIDSVGAPSGENDACTVEYFVKGKLKYDKIPGGIDFLPRFIAYPLNRFFKWAYLEMLAEEQIEYDGEYVREKVNEYFQYLRKYHGEEPLQTKSRQAVFKPAVEDGVFFQ
ncbi:hypothetical protein [Candidatus Nanohalobium constans]|uniref:Uncharacterized protein n=1 Tax=Candidatus Nanohalobium constans TaxID=2565781 RepID=A0A5Q0UEG1_9ARCH|nr:hypothetical protein [Candidatus Nanohalobium constans]QGA79916.1 hypothetical protein LC1Nh_0007 [Candidatus Nanohalobium constans]